MPQLPEELLKSIEAATREAKATIAELHSARKQLIEVEKRDRDRITKLLVDEVEAQVAAHEHEIREESRAALARVIESIAQRLHEKLGLDR